MSKLICSYMALDLTCSWSHSMGISFLWGIRICLKDLRQEEADHRWKEEPIFTSTPIGTCQHFCNSHLILWGRLHFEGVESQVQKGEAICPRSHLLLHSLDWTHVYVYLTPKMELLSLAHAASFVFRLTARGWWRLRTQREMLTSFLVPCPAEGGWGPHTL